MFFGGVIQQPVVISTIFFIVVCYKLIWLRQIQHIENNLLALLLSVGSEACIASIHCHLLQAHPTLRQIQHVQNNFLPRLLSVGSEACVSSIENLLFSLDNGRQRAFNYVLLLCQSSLWQRSTLQFFQNLLLLWKWKRNTTLRYKRRHYFCTRTREGQLRCAKQCVNTTSSLTAGRLEGERRTWLISPLEGGEMCCPWKGMIARARWRKALGGNNQEREGGGRLT